MSFSEVSSSHYQAGGYQPPAPVSSPASNKDRVEEVKEKALSRSLPASAGKSSPGDPAPKVAFVAIPHKRDTVRTAFSPIRKTDYGSTPPVLDAPYQAFSDKGEKEDKCTLL